MLSLSLSLLIRTAHAADDDVDGWSTTATPPDCNDDPADGGAAIYPSAAEDGLDLVDNDCDLSPSVRREYLTAFEFGADWTAVRATFAGGQVSMVPGSATLAATIALKAHSGGVFTFESGELTVGLDVAAQAGTCSVEVTGSSSGFHSASFSGTGYKSVPFPAVVPGENITLLRLRCTGTGSPETRLNWLVVQNGAYEWPPMMDLSLAFDTMGYPDAGRQTVTRLSEGYSAESGGLILAGTDVSGVSWVGQHDPDGTGAENATPWMMANGIPGDFANHELLSVAELYAVWRGDESYGTSGFHDPAEHDVYALEGFDGNEVGGLFQTSNILGNGTAPQEWTEVSAEVGAFKYRDDCTNLAAKAIAPGRLIVGTPADTSWMLVASGLEDHRGIHLWDRGTSTDAGVVFNGLPPAGSSTDAPLPSALATNEVPTGTSTNSQWLLVGYRVIVGSAAATWTTALYACPADFDPAAVADASDPAPECWAVLDALTETTAHDVRDIQSDPTRPGRWYVVDGGRTLAGDGTCDSGESTVYAVDLTDTDGVPTIRVWDTDDADVNAISWNVNSSSVPQSAYYGVTGGCANGQTGDTYGDLVAPSLTVGDEANMLTSVAVDPTGRYLFGFYPRQDNKRVYGCVNVFRADLTESEVGDVLLWRPFEEFVSGDMDWEPATRSHAQNRMDHVDMRGSFPETEPLLETWGLTGINNAIFVPRVDDGYDLLAGGAFHWWAFRDTDGSGSDVGWDSDEADASTDLDVADIAFVWAGDPLSGALTTPTKQSTVTTSAAVCAGCATSENDTNLIIGGGVSDYKLGLMYGKQPDGSRPGADRPCEVHMVGAVFRDISVWRPEDYPSSGSAQAWSILMPQLAFESDIPDYRRVRGVMFSEEGQFGASEVGEAWCWDGYNVSSTSTPQVGFINANFQNWATDPGLMECQDSANDADVWPECGSSGGIDVGLHMQSSGVGMPSFLAAIGDHTAIFNATDAYDGTGVDTDSGGLWLASYDAATGISYTKIPFVAGAGDACVEDTLFQYVSSGGAVTNARSRFAVHPATDADGDIRLFVNSQHADCGLYEVDFTRGSESSAVWSKIDLETSCSVSAGEHPLTSANTQGLAVSRDGRWLLAYGGRAIDGGNQNGGVCALDLDDPRTADPLVPYGGRQVVYGDTLEVVIWSLTSHPHVEDAFYFGGYGDVSCPDCDPSGVFSLQRRYRPESNTYTWGWARVSFDDLENQLVLDLDWGPATGDPNGPASDLYVSTAGGGWWDGLAAW